MPADFFTADPPLPQSFVHGPQDVAALRADLVSGRWRYFIYFRFADWYMDKDGLTLQTLRQYADLREKRDFPNGLSVYEFVVPAPAPASAPVN